MRYILALTLPLYALDQATKWIVVERIGTDETITVVPGAFYLVQVHNTGAAFGMLRDNNAFFIVLSVIGIGVLAYLSRKGAFADAAGAVAGALLAAGILGNLTDRIVRGFVVDFLLFILPVYGPWPAFNAADSCICVAAAILVAAAFFGHRRQKPAQLPR